MTDSERVLHVLLHDLRTPLGVAQGYLRMMQDGRLSSPEDIERAVAKALKALGQTARLCEHANDFLETSNGFSRMTDIAATSLVDQVALIARDQSIETSTGRIPASSHLALAGDAARMADAIVLALTTAGGKRGTLRVEADDTELRFVTPDSASSSASERAPFDGWSAGLPAAVACRRIAWSSGQTLKLEAGTGAIVTLPLKKTGGIA